MSGPLESIDGGKPWYKCYQPMVLGEAPIYRASDSTLHWVDCLVNHELQILEVDPETGDAKGEARVVKLEDSVTVHFFRKNVPGSYICAYYQGVAFMDEKTGKLDIVKEIIPTSKRSEFRFNDGGVDAKGRFRLAEIDLKAMAYGPNKLPESYGEPKGSLWRYDPDGSLHQMLKGGVICGNSLGWSPDNKIFYFHDSVAMKVYAYEFDLETGSISNKRLLIDRRSTYGEPDGMVVDTDGNLWIAMFASYRVMVFDPEGNHLKDILFTANNMTCTAWAGSNFDILFVSSGKDRSLDAKADDEGGHMFRYKPLGVKGAPKHEFAG
ncbi:uncharacterized protein PAC_06391 [Phialocephala subalpina]|uniref:SMP-30/Gluconolactonase/LRE-like region domain-containing protein n=1 Tax=Phialocephala subalpina TaxID=576137 RepID=A0A1L7WUV5_9HELO|nr:uncharacterized protein PAC_06391 [Phialocephala subalpina]